MDHTPQFHCSQADIPSAEDFDADRVSSHVSYICQALVK